MYSRINLTEDLNAETISIIIMQISSELFKCSKKTDLNSISDEVI